MTDVHLGPLTIGEQHPPVVIAEMSGNHNRSLSRALQIVDAAANAGAHVIKLQTYTADTMTLRSEHPSFAVKDPDSLWYGKYLYDLYTEASTPWEWHKQIFARAAEKGIVCFSSPFDESAVDFLEDLGAPAYKIASFENNHFPLLRRVARTGKPVILSTGVSKLSDLALAVECLREAGCKELIVLKCTSTYPASPSNCNIRTITHLQELLDVQVGISDHTLGVGVALAAISLGARVIEKHFTLDRAEGGIDSAFSLEPSELKLLVEESSRAFLSLGSVQYGFGEVESRSRTFKRSIYAQKDVEEGAQLGPRDLKIVRPADGLAPRYWDLVIGKKATRLIKAGTPLSWDDVLLS